MILYALRTSAKRAGDLLWFGLIIAYGIVTGVFILKVGNDYIEPIDKFFDPQRITIPNFCVGDDPKIRYWRVIKRPVLGRYQSHYDTPERAGFPMLPTSPSAPINYFPKPAVLATPTLSDFMGRAPSLPPGDYVAVVTWTFQRPWHADTTVELVSNVFTVMDCKQEQPSTGVAR